MAIPLGIFVEVCSVRCHACKLLSHQNERYHSSVFHWLHMPCVRYYTQGKMRAEGHRRVGSYTRTVELKAHVRDTFDCGVTE